MDDGTADKPYRSHGAGEDAGPPLDEPAPSDPPIHGPPSDPLPSGAPPSDPPPDPSRSDPSPSAEAGATGRGRAPTGPRPSYAGVRRGTRAARRVRRRRILVRRLVAVGAFTAVGAVLVGVAVAWPFGDGAATPAGDEPAPAPSDSASPSPAISPQAAVTVAVDPAERGFTITAGGDVLGDRSIRAVMDAHGPAGPFRKVTGLFKASDFGLVNLETPLTDKGSPQTWKDVVFKGDPRLAEGLSESGVNVVTLANNHAMDQGASGLLDTMKWLRRNDVTVCGAGKDLEDAYTPRVVKTDGVAVGFLGFTDVLPVGYPATVSGPGTTPGRSDVAAMKRAVAKAAKRSDYVVVSWHWNFEFTTSPSSLELMQGKAAIDAGADLVIAHHPHVLQGLQAYNGGLIAYSLGDLVFDHCSGAMAETVIIQARVDARRIVAKLIPVALAYDGTPSRARGEQAATILKRVKSYSAALGTKVRIEGDFGYVTVKR